MHTHKIAHKYAVNNMRDEGQILSCLIILSWRKQTFSHHGWINGEHMLGGGHCLPVAAI